RLPAINPRAARAEGISRLRKETRIEEHFPQVIVGILEVPRVSAPESLLRLFDDSCAGARRLLHDRVDFLFARHVVADRKLRRSVSGLGEAGVMGEVVARPGRELESAAQFEERNRSVFELRPDNALGRRPKAVTVKAQRTFEVVDADGQNT